MDLFQLALQGKTPVMYEYFLVGSVLDSAKDGFIEILRGLCDNPENRPIEFLESENIYSATNPNGAEIILRARINKDKNTVDGSAQYCHLRYCGQTDIKLDRERKAMSRSYIDCLTTINLNEYLLAIGMNLDMELLLRGYLFHKGKLKITVFKIFTPSQTGDLQQLSQSHLVEISCIVPAGSETVAEEVKRFADMFKPYVKMEKTHQIMEEVKHLL